MQLDGFVLTITENGIAITNRKMEIDKVCMNSETVEALHALTSEMKAEHERRDEWLKFYDDGKRDTEGMRELVVTRTEAERIFSDRIAAHEARLKEQGWTRTVRVEPDEAAERERRNRNIVDLAKAL